MDVDTGCCDYSDNGNAVNKITCWKRYKMTDRPRDEQLEATPALYLENRIKEYIATSPENRLSAFPAVPIFDEVLIGYADGDDAIFQDYKRIIGSFHLTPREALEFYLQGRADAAEKHPSRVSVISMVLTTPREVRLSMRQETVIASLMGNHAAREGKSFLTHKIGPFVVSLLQDLGYRAVAPDSAFLKISQLPNGPASNWSEKHIAYAAGLGTFGLNSGLITPRGITIHLASVVTDLALPASPRVYESHMANCTFFRDRSCLRCIQRCPSGALSEGGYDKIKCRDYHFRELPEILRRSGREGYVGNDPSCGLCQTKVPCESMIPPVKLPKTR
jgi:epoxyqueuosine reductase